MPGIIKIAILCIAAGAASIPISFGINSSPFIVWLGNAMGSLLSALVVIFIGDRLASDEFRRRVGKHRYGRKITLVFDQGDDNKKVVQARTFINRHGLRIFAFLCPIFPGVLISTTAVYIVGLDKKTYKRWLFAGIFFASAVYVFGYWWLFRR